MKKVLLLIVFFSTMLFSAEFENPKSVVRLGTELRFPEKYISFDFGESCSKNFIVQKMVKTLHFQCSDFQFLKMFR